jgi:hypothetical protein
MSDRMPWRELADVWVQVQRIRFELSRFEEGQSFAIVDVVRCDTGEALAVTTGARAVLEEIGRMRDDEDRLAAPVMLVANRTGRGRVWYQLIPGGVSRPLSEDEKAKLAERTSCRRAPNVRRVQTRAAGTSASRSRKRRE